MYLQVGPGEENLDLASEMDFINTLGYTSAFQQLRTQEQLGYIVYTQLERGPPGKVTPFDGEGGGEGIHPGGPLAWSVVVQSPDKNPEELEERVEAWIAGFRDELANISDEVFEATVASMVRVRVWDFWGESVTMVVLRLGRGGKWFSVCETDSIAIGFGLLRMFQVVFCRSAPATCRSFFFLFLSGGGGGRRNNAKQAADPRSNPLMVVRQACRHRQFVFLFLFFDTAVLYQMEANAKRGE